VVSTGERYKMKYVIVSLVCALVATAIAPFVIQFAKWGASQLRSKQDELGEALSQEKDTDTTGEDK
jgi:hypothetical protein